MRPGPTRYARSGDYHIAYSVTGEGPHDLLYVPTWLSHIEHVWEHPKVAGFFSRLTTVARLIMFDRRGSGLSDAGPVPTLEDQMDDVKAVMDAPGSGGAPRFAPV